MHALVCLDTRVLPHAMAGRIHAARADQQITVPVVMTREAVAAGLALLNGTAPLVATRLYGSGLRVMEAVRPGGKDRDAPMKPLPVHSGQGDTDRVPTVPATPTPWLQNPLAGVTTRHQQDATLGPGEVYRPQALARKSPHAAKAGGWQYVFPAQKLAVDPRSGITRRHHVDRSVINKAIKVAVQHAGLAKTISAHAVRHAFATHLLQRGTDIHTIPPRLGHTEVTTTTIWTHMLQQGDQAGPSPLDDIGV